MRFPIPLRAVAPVLLLASGLSGCGGSGDGDGSFSPLPARSVDARNGTYQMYAADAQLYTLALDFDAGTWRVQGNGVDSSGDFAANGSGFTFTPAGALPALNNARFTAGSDAIVGGFRFASGVVPFIAARTFVTSVAGAAGAYKFLTRTVDPAAPPDNFIFTGEIVAPGTWRFCNDPVIFTIANCPAPSLVTGSLSLSGDQFTATVPGSTYSFRIATIGGERVLLRAGASTGTSRRFWIGTDQAAGFANGTFTGVNTAAQATGTTITSTSLVSTLTSESDVDTTRTGSVANAGVPGLLAVTTLGQGNYFAMRTGELAFVFAAENNPVQPGYVEIGRR